MYHFQWMWSGSLMRPRDVNGFVSDVFMLLGNRQPVSQQWPSRISIVLHVWRMFSTSRAASLAAAVQTTGPVRWGVRVGRRRLRGGRQLRGWWAWQRSDRLRQSVVWELSGKACAKCSETRYHLTASLPEGEGCVPACVRASACVHECVCLWVCIACLVHASGCSRELIEEATVTLGKRG